MAIKTLLPKQQVGMDQRDQWLEKREEIKTRFQDNIGMPNFHRKPYEIETIETTEGESNTEHKLCYVIREEVSVRA